MVQLYDYFTRLSNFVLCLVPVRFVQLYDYFTRLSNHRRLGENRLRVQLYDYFTRLSNSQLLLGINVCVQLYDYFTRLSNLKLAWMSKTTRHYRRNNRPNSFIIPCSEVLNQTYVVLFSFHRPRSHIDPHL